jgi:hypothetical protein
MIFSAQNKDISALLVTGKRFVEKSKSIGVKVDKKTNIATLRLLDDTGAYFAGEFSAKIEKSGYFSISLEIFESLIKGKTLELEWSVIEHKLHIKSLNTRMSGKDVPLLTDEVVLAEKAKQGISFGKYQSKALLMLSECAIPSFFQKILPEYVVAKNGKLIVACADIMTSAVALLSTEKLNIPEFSIPAQYAKLMREVIGDTCTISLKKEKIVIDTDLLHIELPMLQVDTIATVDKILALDKDKDKASFAVESHTLRGELDNLLVVYEDKSPLRIRLKNNMIMDYKTNHGNFNSSIKIEDLKGTADFYVDVEMFRSILARMNGKVLVNVKANVVVMQYSPIKNLNIRHVIATVNPGEG